MNAQHQINTLVMLARACMQEAIKRKRYPELYAWNKGRAEAYMGAARFLDGRILSTGRSRKMGLAPMVRRAA